MKMRLTGFLAFAVLSISILSYGVSGSVFADSHNIPPISVSSDVEVIGNGANVVISGNIRDYDSGIHSGQDITVIIKSPDNNIVTIKQISPNSDGSFQFNIVAGGKLWKSAGDYIVDVHFGANAGETILNYVGGEQVISDPPPPPPVDNQPDPFHSGSIYRFHR